MDETDWVFSLAKAEERFPAPTSVMRYHEALKRGAMTLGLYAPRRADTQGPHLRDELYVVVAGSGVFVKSGERQGFEAGDAI